jgi:hypothetical protein
MVSGSCVAWDDGLTGGTPIKEDYGKACSRTERHRLPGVWHAVVSGSEKLNCWSLFSPFSGGTRNRSLRTVSPASGGQVR